MIALEQFPEHLKTISKDQWARLFGLLPEIQKMEKFSELPVPEMISNGAHFISYYHPALEVTHFFEIVYELELVPVFDWINWTEGNQLLENENQRFENLDTVTLCRLLTSIIRKDRYCEGFLMSLFENGTVEKIIVSLKTQIENGSVA